MEIIRKASITTEGGGRFRPLGIVLSNKPMKDF